MHFPNRRSWRSRPRSSASGARFRLAAACAALSVFLSAAGRIAAAPEPVATWPSSRTHPLSYNGRTLTRDSAGNYYMVMRGNNEINVWKRSAADGLWANLGQVNDTALATGEGDCATIAVDGLNRIHVVFYDGPAPNLVHKVSADGARFGPRHLVQAAVSWQTTAAGGPYLHIDRGNGLHVAFVDEAANKPYYAYSRDGGSTWAAAKVSDLGGGNLRPSVTTSLSGRLFVGFSSPGFRAAISDDRGASFAESSPANAASWTVVNCRLAASDDTVYVTGQKISPEPRAIVLSRTRGSVVNWSPWEMVSAGTGADASLYISASGQPEVIWRTYPETPNRIHRSRAGATWSSITLTGDDDYIFPYAYWQEYHRWQPGANKVALLAPDLTHRQIYFLQLDDATYFPDTLKPVPVYVRSGPGGPTVPEVASSSVKSFDAGGRRVPDSGRRVRGSGKALRSYRQRLVLPGSLVPESGIVR